MAERDRLDAEDAAYLKWCEERGLDPNARREHAEGYWDEFWESREEKS